MSNKSNLPHFKPEEERERDGLEVRMRDKERKRREIIEFMGG